MSSSTVIRRADRALVATTAGESTMRLADFIEKNAEAILAEWVEFAAASGPAGKTLDLVGLRDHALEMLNHIVTDLRTPQTGAQRAAKSKGNAAVIPNAPETAAEVHGAGRAESGFTLAEMVSEYRALRASVIQLWTDSNGTLNRREDIEDLMRFNEAIDQALAESVSRYNDDLDHSKEMFLAILGHDLRTPLGAVIMSSRFMLDTGDLEEPHLTLTGRIERSARRMNRLVGDLLDFTRSRLGSGVPIVRAEIDLAKVAAQAIEETTAAHPNSIVRFDTQGRLHGHWDAARLGQVLSNLLTNAVEHGSPKTPICVTIDGAETDVTIRVANRGPAIPASDLKELFSPLKRVGKNDRPRSSNLGLGLYIAERIVTAHAGTIDVTSTPEKGTTFSIRLPRQG
jgi:signal transduction histidine kinase